MKKTIIINSLKSKKMSIVIIGIVFHSLLFTNSFSQSGWVKQTIGTYYDSFNNLVFFNLNTGLVISGQGGTSTYYGKLYKTTNGGINWISSAFTNPDFYLNGHFFNENSFVLVGYRGDGLSGVGLVAIYTNNVRNDIFISPINHTITYISAVSWIDQNTGFVGGSDFNIGHAGRVLKTTNQGQNWVEITPIPYSSDVPRMKFFDYNTGYIIDGSEFKKTSNSGQSWTTISNVLLTQNDIHFITRDTGYICGDNGYVRISSDTGNTWQLRPVGKNVRLFSIKFLNSKTGWVCGDTGYIFKTTNAGINWQRQFSGKYSRLLRISVLDSNNVWIGADSGVILKTTTGGVSFVNQISNVVPDDFKLFQNYPNPFNSFTKIKYQISSLANVKIIVCDLLGREIKTLVNENKQAGSYLVSFNGSELASGIYFYKIVAGNFTQVKRMVLIK